MYHHVCTDTERVYFGGSTMTYSPRHDWHKMLQSFGFVYDNSSTCKIENYVSFCWYSCHPWRNNSCKGSSRSTLTMAFMRLSIRFVRQRFYKHACCDDFPTLVETRSFFAELLPQLWTENHCVDRIQCFLFFIDSIYSAREKNRIPTIKWHIFCLPRKLHRSCFGKRLRCASLVLRW